MKYDLLMLYIHYSKLQYQEYEVAFASIEAMSLKAHRTEWISQYAHHGEV